MRTVIGYMMVVLGLIAFMSCSEEEEPNGPPGSFTISIISLSPTRMVRIC